MFLDTKSTSFGRVRVNNGLLLDSGGCMHVVFLLREFLTQTAIILIFIIIVVSNFTQLTTQRTHYRCPGVNTVKTREKSLKKN